MAIVGIEALIFGVDDVDKCTRFFEDFGLSLLRKTEGESVFELEERSRVVLRRLDDPSLPKSTLKGNGVKEVWWGVDSEDDLERLVAELQHDRELVRDPNGTVHFTTDFGLPLALCRSAKKPVITRPDPVNSPGNINRLNTQRKWRLRARPKVINHVVFAVPDYEKAFEFFHQRLRFRLSDRQGGYGIYCRCDGSNAHHTIFLLNASCRLPRTDGSLSYHHANFGVEDVDEIMVGANYLERRGWPKSELGLGRHRLDSALFLYLPCPAGGEVEYGADQDMIDDNWIPRDWIVPTFGYISFVHNLPEFLMEEPAWELKYLEGYVPKAKPRGHPG